jgi:CBS domain-containing protein
MMDWRRIRYTPVEDKQGKLIGLVTLRHVLRHMLKLKNHPPENPDEIITVKDIMNTKPITVGPNASITEAMALMRNHKIGCLPVVKNEELIGIITEMDFLKISGRLIDRLEG